MNKILLTLGAAAAAVAPIASTIACGSSNEDGINSSIFEDFDLNEEGYEGFKGSGEIKINFIPSNDPSDATIASAALQKFLNEKVPSVKWSITVSSDYNTAAESLKNNTTDLAFLPVNTWAEKASGTNFILQAGRQLQVAILDWDGTDVELPGAYIDNQANAVKSMNDFSQLYLSDVTSEALAKSDLSKNQTAFKSAIDDTTHRLNAFAIKAQEKADSIEDESEFIAGSYESFIFGNTDDDISSDILDIYDMDTYNEDWKHTIDDWTGIKYGATSNTSGASYVFPQLWFNDHFDTNFNKDAGEGPEIEIGAQGYGGNIDSVEAGTYTFAGGWADVRTTASSTTSKTIAIGVEDTRIANDGIQARSNMSAHDLAVLQELFVRLINDENGPEVVIEDETVSVFSVYNHEAYTKITNTSQKVAFIDKDTVADATMLKTKPEFNEID